METSVNFKHSVVIWILCIIPGVVFSSSSASVVEDVKEETNVPSRFKRSVDGSQLPPLPMRSAMTGGATYQRSSSSTSGSAQARSGYDTVPDRSGHRTADQGISGDEISTRVVFDSGDFEVSAEANNRRQYQDNPQYQSADRQRSVSASDRGTSGSSSYYPRRTSRTYVSSRSGYPAGSSGTHDSQSLGSQASNTDNSDVLRRVMQNSRTQQYPRARQSSGTQRYPGILSGVGTRRRYDNTRLYDPTRRRTGGTRYLGQGGNARNQYGQFGSVTGLTSSRIPQTGVMSSDPNCPATTHRVYINGLECSNAVTSLGSFICYNYERVSRECCEKCLLYKRPNDVGCEYGDRSYQCRNIQHYDCYNDRNREICCQTCASYRAQYRAAGRSSTGCEYGDWTPRCQVMRERPHLCALEENQRLCCHTCPPLADRSNPDCMWGDQDPALCRPFADDNSYTLRINCYIPAVRQACCSSCNSLASRLRHRVPNCEFGDRPTVISTSFGVLDCRRYIHRFGAEVCSRAEISSSCCYTCYEATMRRRRYRN